MKIEGLGDTIRESIIDGISDCSGLIRKLLDVGVSIMSEKTKNIAPADEPSYIIAGIDPAVPGEDRSVVYQPLAGITCCWTGTRDYTKEFEALGGIVKSGISKGLHLLAQKDAMSVSNKTKKAEAYGTKIISVDYLKKIIDGEVKVKLVNDEIQFIS